MEIQPGQIVVRRCNRALLRASIAVLAFAVGIFLIPSRAAADNINISFQESGVNGGAITQVTTGVGSASFSGTYGTFSVNNVSAIGSPSLTEPGLETSSMNVSGSSGGTLNVFITETGLTSPSGANDFLSSFTSQLFSGNVTSVTEQTFLGDPGTGTLLASQTFSSIGSATAQTLVNLPSTYNETIEYTIVTTGSGSVNDTVNISAAEPSTAPLLGLGLAGIFGIGLKRRLVLG